MVAARLLIDGPLSGPQNMGRDEALLESCNSNGPVTLRFYQWSRPTISLGYFQDFADYERLVPPAGGLPVVRRTTGGGAILHDLEVTYSIAFPMDHPLVAGRPNELYVLAHRAIISAVGNGAQMATCRGLPCAEFGQRGPFFCFARRHALDVLVTDRNGIGGYSKLAGSAQRRTRRAILQHGSIILDSRFAQHPVATWSGLAGGIGFDEAIRRLVPSFEGQLGISLMRCDWTEQELAAAGRLEAKYAGEDWTKHRRR